jgi:hypothetical protein
VKISEREQRRRREEKTCLRCNITITNQAAKLLIHAKKKEPRERERERKSRVKGKRHCRVKLQIKTAIIQQYEIRTKDVSFRFFVLQFSLITFQ